MFSFAASDEQLAVAEVVRVFTDRELRPHDDEVERLGVVPAELAHAVRDKAIEAGLYAWNMPAELGGGGLDHVTQALAEMELSRSGPVSISVHRPAPILLACQGEQRDEYLLPTIRGERRECFALTEPEAGSDARGIRTRAVRDGDDWVINGTKQFISDADHADFILLIAVTGENETPRGPRPRITCFLVDKQLPGVALSRIDVVGTRGYNPHVITFNDVRVPDRNILGSEGHGFDFAREWLFSGRVMLAAMCVGRGRLILELAADWARTRRAFGRTIGEFQGTGFKLADMRVELKAAELLTLEAAWKLDQGTLTDVDASIANLFASEMVGRAADNGVQIFGGMGLATEFLMERLWRDARVERIWEGTSEIHRDLIARRVLRGG
ncbi:MAG: acyl-CoA dehydrogenase family protein [Gaiellales bacterium]